MSCCAAKGASPQPRWWGGSSAPCEREKEGQCKAGRAAPEPVLENPLDGVVVEVQAVRDAPDVNEGSPRREAPTGQRPHHDTGGGGGDQRVATVSYPAPPVDLVGVEERERDEGSGSGDPGESRRPTRSASARVSVHIDT